MLATLLIGALLVGRGGTEQAPVFHAEAYVVVSNSILFFDRGGGSRRLTSDNFQAIVNEKLVAIDVSEDPKRPGSYILSINPPVELRDGKSHRIDVKVRNWPKADDDQWHDLKIRWTAVFTKPGAGL